MNARITLLLCCALGLSGSTRGQRIISEADRTCATGEGSVHVSALYSDSLCSSFLICIDTEVKPHVHVHHTEHVFVLDGEGVMRLGDVERTVRTGDAIIIPAGTVHAVKVRGTSPLRVISVQAPRFDGTDRVFVTP